jgi:uncharacterized protein
MSGENDLTQLLKKMQPQLQTGDYVFCTVKDLAKINIADVLMTFKEQEGITVILKKEIADCLSLSYSYIAAWITLTVHSSLEAVGLTAAFAKALTNANISCNVVAAFYHDHIFVAKADAAKAMQVLYSLSKG